MTPTNLADQLRAYLNESRMIDTAMKLISIPSPTGSAGEVSDALADCLQADGFSVRREAGGHFASPAVLAILDSGVPGPCLQFNGHLDVVHLPFVPPRREGNLLRGSGSCDMKGGLATAIEALRMVRDSQLLKRGRILLCAHDLHEAPWGLGEQLNELILNGHHGDAVLLPEPLTDHLPIRGRGNATWKVTLRRSGPPVHEVVRPQDQPNVIQAGADFVQRLCRWDEELSHQQDPIAGKESVFIGQIHSGEIYNQYPQECWLEGTRRWLPGINPQDVEKEFRSRLAQLGADFGIAVDCDWRLIRGAYQLDVSHPIVNTFQEAYQELHGKSLPHGPKAFVDDGNSFSSLANIPTITHGPKAGGQHTVDEWIDVPDMSRVALLYAMTAIRFCICKSVQ
jgi:acetylornithine deacetylase/succinyl-diaminopimelate desuccinylase-like protein